MCPSSPAPDLIQRVVAHLCFLHRPSGTQARECEGTARRRGTWLQDTLPGALVVFHSLTHSFIHYSFVHSLPPSLIHSLLIHALTHQRCCCAPPMPPHPKVGRPQQGKGHSLCLKELPSWRRETDRQTINKQVFPASHRSFDEKHCRKREERDGTQAGGGGADQSSSQGRRGWSSTRRNPVAQALMLHVASNSLTDMLFLFYCWKPTTREGETPFQGHTAIKQGPETLGSGKEGGGGPLPH